MDARALPFAKGHGTGNDFVVLPDPDGLLDPSPSLVASLCDRRFGIGGDGVLRVVRTAKVPEVADRAGEAPWFMDYRNADGSLAEMCGNGARVYARYLVQAGLEPGPRVTMLTRAGRVTATVGAETVAVEMPFPEVLGASSVTVAGDRLPGTVATCGNPNLVCRVAEPEKLDLTGPMELDPEVFPAGANVEFYTAVELGGPDASDASVREAVANGVEPGGLAVRLRVVERGVGETLSCGSGACAAAAVVLRDAGQTSGEVAVLVPGGELRVAIEDGRCVLSGPAVIVATGEFGPAAFAMR